MKRVRTRGTTPELSVRRLLTELGARYRLHPADLPGRPDVANRRRGKVIFVHGCFWHGHDECGRGRIPKANRAFWAEKLRRNVERDARKVNELRSVGYEVLVVWECELKDEDAVRTRLMQFWFDHPATAMSSRSYT
jgi:DNA mismatch endonuclease, patch repair protein